mgnify:CR=1 FL=1
MSSSPSPAVRSVLLVAVADMVVQFTGLADGHVARLAAAVRDPHELVRRQVRGSRGEGEGREGREGREGTGNNYTW